MTEHKYEEQDEKEKVMRQNKKGIKLHLPVAAACLVIGAIITAMAVRIHNQNLLIASQSEELNSRREENDMISDATHMQAGETDSQNTQYAQTVRNHCISEAEKADAMLAEGDRIGALRTAYSVFPGEGQEDIPYTPQVAFALSESLHIYASDLRYYSDRQLEADTDVLFMKVSQNSSLVLAVDESDMLYVWAADDGALVDRFEVTNYDGIEADRRQFAFIDSSRFVYPTAYGFALYDTERHSIVYECVDEDNRQFLRIDGKERDAVNILPGGFGAGDRCEQVVVDEGRNQYLVRMRSGYYLVQADTGEVLSYVHLSEDDYYRFGCGDEIAFCGEDMFAVAMDGRLRELRLYSAEDGSLIRTYLLNGGSVPFMCCWEGILYLLENGKDNDTIYAVDITMDDILWTYQESGYGLNDLAPAYMEGSRYLACTGYDTCVVLNKRTGRLEERFHYDSEIIYFAGYMDSESFLIFTGGGTWYYLFPDTMQNMYRIDFTATSTDIKMFGVGDDFVATLPEKSEKITLYRSPVGSRAETFQSTYGRYDSGDIDHTGQYLAVAGVSSYGKGDSEDETYVEMLDMTSGDMLWSYRGEGNLLDIKFYEEREALVLVTEEDIRLLGMFTGKEVADYFYLTGEESLYNGIVDSDDYIGTDATGRYVFVRLYDTVAGYDLQDGSIKYVIKDILLAGTEVVFALDPSMTYLAYTFSVGGSLNFYRLSDYESEGEVVLSYKDKDMYDSFEYTGIQTSYIDSLFFDDGGLETGVPKLYVEYRNGKLEVYSLEAGIEGLTENDNAKVSVAVVRTEEKPIRTYQDLDLSLIRYIHPDGKEYAIAAGDSGAYMLLTETGARRMPEDDLGQITAHIDGFLALDGVNDLLYLRGGENNCIYRVPVYDAAMLAQEAADVLARQQ